MERTAGIIGAHCGRRPKAIREERRRVLEGILRERWRALQELPAELMGHCDPPDDAAQQIQEEMVSLAVLDGRRRLLGQVREALCRLAAGRYGLCADCGEAIPVGRLRALPFALRCWACQVRLEVEAGREPAPRRSSR